MDRSEVERRVSRAILRVLKLPPGEVTPEANFIFDLGADSMQSLQLVAAFEEEFGVEMDQEAALAVLTVASAVDFIKAILDSRG
jgi:acyl carrier protein